MKISAKRSINNMILTDRDMKLLRFLGDAGAIRTARTSSFYNDSNSYHLKRVQKLAAAKLLKVRYGYIIPTAKGLRVAGCPAPPLRMTRQLALRHALAADIVSGLPGWVPTYARELKQSNILSRSSRACAVITQNEENYAIYVLDELKPTARARLRSEMSELVLAGIKRILIFCKNEKILQVFGQEPPDGLMACCVLTYPGRIATFRRFVSKDFYDFLKKRFPGASLCKRSFAHLEYKDAYITILIHNDLVKKAELLDYLKYVQTWESRRCIVVAAPGQQLDIPGVEIVYDELAKP